MMALSISRTSFSEVNAFSNHLVGDYKAALITISNNTAAAPFPITIIGMCHNCTNEKKTTNKQKTNKKKTTKNQVRQVD